MISVEQGGMDMRSIYIRSLLIVAGLAVFLAIEALAPRGVDAAPARAAVLGTAGPPA
jgi:hypothetical protein